MKLRAMICIFGSICLAVAPLRGDEKHAYSFTTTHVVDLRDRSYCGNCFFQRGVTVSRRTFQIPVASFGVHKQPGKPSRYTYFVLFKTDGTPYTYTSEVGGMFSFNVSDTEFGLNSDGHERITLHSDKRKDKIIDIAWQHETDKATGAITKEVIKLGGVELKKGAPRVYLVNLTNDKIVFEPVKVELPIDAPPAGGDDKAWEESVLRAVEELKKSPEVKKSFD